MNCDPLFLATASSCYRCLPHLMAARTYLLCKVGNQGFAMVPTNLAITSGSSAASITVTWTNPAMGTTNEVWRSTDGINFSLFQTVAGNVNQITDSSGLAANSFFYYKVRSCTAGICTAFSTVISCVNQFVAGAVVTISFPTLVRAFGPNNSNSFVANNNALLTSVSLPALKLSDSNIDLSGNANLTTVSLDALVTIPHGNLFLGSCNLNSLSLASLTGTAQDIQVQSNVNCTSVSMPLLTVCGNILSLSSMPALTSVNLNSLTNVGNRLDFNADTSITSISLPVLTHVQGDGTNEIRCTGCTNLSNWNAPSWVPNNAVNANSWTNCALTASSVNQVLRRGVLANTTVETYSLGGGTNSPPTGQGIADKATLIGNGNTVTTN